MPHCAACGDDHPDANTLCPRTGEVMTIGPCGTRLDRYDIERWIGGGGMGAVYLARHTMLQHRVALKLLHPSIAQRGDILERFLREARATASLGSPHIVKVFDCAVTPEGTAFIAMEALEGESLQALIERERVVAPTRAVSIVTQVLDGLSVAHAAGIVHRDMKPGNVFLTPVPGAREERATILDFGISKMRSGSAASLTQTGTVMGTPHYMAPEQIWNSKDIDHRADIYAVGVMLYEMVSGRLPFDAGSTAELLVKACTTDPIPLRDLNLPLPPGLVAAVDRAMTRDLDRRFATARDFSDALRDAGAPTTRPTLPQPVVQVPELPPVAAAPPAMAPTAWGVVPPPSLVGTQPIPPMAPSGRRTWIIVAIAGLATVTLVCLLAIAWYSVYEGGEGPTAAHDAGLEPSMVPIQTPPGSGVQVMPTPNSITIVPGPEGVILRPSADGLRIVPNRASNSVSDEDDDE
ncbi:MAG: protein kinase [Polyangiales bacterium]